MPASYKLRPLLVVAALTGCDAIDDHREVHASVQVPSALSQRINAQTPEALNRSYQHILGSMTRDQREQFVKALAVTLQTCSRKTADSDTAFRKKIDGKTASAIIADAQGRHED